VLSGCGLSDYEAKMVSEQKRVQRFDDEAEFLDEPVEIPVKKEAGSTGQPSTQVDVFFRPPCGISSKPETTTRGELYRYLHPASQPVFGPRAKIDPKRALKDLVSEVDLGVSIGGEGNDFFKKVQQAYGLQKPTFVPETKQPPGHNRLEFQKTTFTDTSTPPLVYSIYLCSLQNVHIAMVFLVPQDKASNPDSGKTVEKMIDLSLQSLAVGQEATEKRMRLRSPK
jgi:hypothetical protein